MYTPPSEAIDIAFICDDNFALPTRVAIQSIFQNRNAAVDYHLHIVCDNISDSNKGSLTDLSSPGFTIETIEGSEQLDKKSFCKEYLHVSTAATLKFCLSDLFPEIDRLLYLDGDVIVQSDLTQLFETDITNVYAAVAKDYNGLTYPNDVWQRLGINHTAYFNSGVMLLNLKKMREDSISKKLIEYRLHGINHYMDQDAFNVVFDDQVLCLEFSDNATTVNWREKTSEDLAAYYGLAHKADKYEYLRSARIIHFCSPDKPWLFYDTHLADVWFEYYLSSPLNRHPLNRKSLLSHISNPAAVATRIQPASALTRNHIVCQSNSATPRFSIITPVYNAEKFLNECIESVQAQTLTNFELICVDDGSTDRSLNIIREHAKSDPRIKCIQQRNLYAGVARNNAIDLSRGEYIVFLDSDDILPPNSLERFYQYAKRYDAEILISGISNFIDHHPPDPTQQICWLAEHYLPALPCFSAADNYAFLFNFTPGGPCGKCFKRTFILDNKLKFLDTPKSEDFIFIHSGLTLAERIVPIKESLYWKRDNPNSLENTKDQNPLVFWDAVMATKDCLQKQGTYSAVKQSFVNDNINRFFYNLKTIKTEEAEYAIVKKLCQVFRQELYLDIYPDKYFYEPHKRSFLIQKLNEYFAFDIK